MVPVFLLLLWSVLCAALHESDVGVINWHKEFVGVPNLAGPPPVFHRVGSKSTRSVVLAATESNAFAAFDPISGEIVWRHIHEDHDPVATFRAFDDGMYFHIASHSFIHISIVVVVLSGPEGATMRIFEALTGHILFEAHLPMSQPSVAGNAGSDVGFAPGTKQIYTLYNGNSVSLVDGSVKWTWVSPDQSSMVVYSKIFATTEAIYAVGLAKSFASPTLYVTALSPSTGDELASVAIPSTLESFFLVRGTPISPVSVVWLEKGTVRSFALTPSLEGNPSHYKTQIYSSIQNVGLERHGLLVGVKADGASSLLRMSDTDSMFTSVWDFESTRNNDFKYTGGLDKSNNPYLARIYWSEVFKKMMIDIFSPHLGNGKGLTSGFTFDFDINANGEIKHVAMDAALSGGRSVLARLFVTSSTGAVQLWQQDRLQWCREESLASISVSQFVELPEKIASNVEFGEETLAQRIARQVLDLNGFPSYVYNFVKRFVLASSSSLSSGMPDGVHRDLFGFRQVVVVATSYNKVFGIDSANGDILWSRRLGLGPASQVGGTNKPVKMFMLKTVSDGGTPEIALLAQRVWKNTLVDTVLFHVNAVTGAPVKVEDTNMDGKVVIPGTLVNAYLLSTEDARAIVMFDEFLQVYLYPDTEASTNALASAASYMHFPLSTSSGPLGGRVTGHQVSLKPFIKKTRYIGHATWTLALPANEEIVEMLPVSRGPVASFGNVLGNRTTLYKYLNPRLFVVTTRSVPTSLSKMCALYVADSGTGTIIYRVSLPTHDNLCDVKATMTENWLVYHYYDNAAGFGSTKGYRMVSVEFYEGQGVDQSTASLGVSAYSDKILDMTTYERSFLYPHRITAMTTTSTKFGITAKDLVVARDDDKIHTIPRRLLDPRRPSGKPTSLEQEEQLITYEPVLPDDPRRIVSHAWKISSVNGLLTSPALLESTSLIFAYGLDLFVTRVAPSNTFDLLSENFNKAQLVFTITGLATAIMITRPMVKRKQLKERWY
ncbi:DUF1620-domain-containing protein [Fistulina hepatica ATCC 64428]|uniref:ER membrane protein complex subunit 1 n=1 Tax=Fistulina hepatica ATCC 64428 TaxID=1128425 RepID=A0A0D7AP15_9AGAR|nr:DUF1620-domain-containing protein [Fistulina hepatica ATCC 64428]